MSLEPDDIDRQNQNAYDDLLVAIETGVGSLSLLIAVCDDLTQRDQIIQQYETELAPDFRSYRLTLARGEPSLKAAIAHQLEENEYLRQGGKAILTITGTEQLYFLTFGEEKSEQDTFFGYLQWTREALREFRFPIVLWFTQQMAANLSRKSPDFWSWRKGVFRFASRKTATAAVEDLEALRSALQSLNLPALDEDTTLLPLEDLKALIQKTEQRSPNAPLLASLYNQMGRVYSGRIQQGIAQDYRTEQAQAIEYFEKAIGLQEELGQELELASSLNLLGYLYDSQGRYVEAEPLYQQALALRQQLLGEEHPSVATSLNNLASLYNSQGRYPEAEPLYRQALALRQQLLGEEHPDVAASLNNLAGLYESQGRYAEAEPLYQQALALHQQLLGEEHPDVATSLNNLALLYYSQGRYSEAEPLYLKALAVDRRSLPADHPDLVIDLVNLALLYQDRERFAEAEPLYREALAIREARLGTSHPDTLVVRKNLEQMQSALQAPQPQQWWLRFFSSLDDRSSRFTLLKRLLSFWTR